MSTAPPLTHHEILTLVEPFARQRRHVDLAATQRIERRLAFKPIEHAASAPDVPALRETLELDCLGTGSYRLTRTLVPAGGGPKATATAMGPLPGDLLARVEAVAPASQFTHGHGFVIARSLTLGAGTPPALVRGVVQLPALTLTMAVSYVRGVSAEITLQPAAQALDLPQDLLAVLGWDWSRGVPAKGQWTSRLRLRGDTPRRTQRAQAALQRVAVHLATTLAMPPAQFHDRLRRARWAVAFRRAIPLLTAVGLVAAMFLLPRFTFDDSPGLGLLLYHVPTVLLAISFCLQELPRLEIPPLPRRSVASDWLAQR